MGFQHQLIIRGVYGGINIPETIGNIIVVLNCSPHKAQLKVAYSHHELDKDALLVHS
jgi:hypothetical protein